MQPLLAFLTNEQCQNSKLINYECASQFSILRTLQTSIKRDIISQNCLRLEKQKVIDDFSFYDKGAFIYYAKRVRCVVQEMAIFPYLEK